LAEPLYVVFNPQSGKGRGARLVEPVLAALSAAGAAVEHGRSTRAGEEAELARAAVARGFRTVVAVGGDGTWSNVASALIRSGRLARLGLVPAGTGCDLAKSLGIPGNDVAACARIIHAGNTRAIDVGRLLPDDRYFINVAGFGYDIAVIEDSWNVRWLRGGALYLYCALRQLHRFPGFPVEMAAEGEAPVRRELLMLVIANARVFGGGFRIAPQADLGDGLLDATAFANMGVVKRLQTLVHLLRGTHGGTPAVSETRARSFRLRFERPPAYETDGEWNQAVSSELRIECVPRALEVLAPPPE
jgi:diacylglycerol kinase (ATP)